jgi:transcription elongation factor Elf1
LGRRRRKTVKIVKKKLPRFFRCPSCENESISVIMDRPEKKAIIICSSCNLREEIPIEGQLQVIDAYCRYIDKFYSS